jgi:RNA polymerase sigma-70 factor (ECF subfamily)
VREHYAPLYRFLRPLTGRREDAEDLALQTLQLGRTNIRRFDGRASLRTWLYRIAYREYLHWRRRQRWHLSLFSAPPHEESRYDAVLDADLLRTAIAQLPDPQRVAFVLSAVQEMSLEEIAAVTGVPLGTVKSRLHHARKRLQALIQDAPEEMHYATEPSRP